MTSRTEMRRQEILDVAAQLLAQKGYRDTSMLEIARQASASKETLYSWFGDKKGLFAELIRRNASKVRVSFEKSVETGDNIEATLEEFGTSLLTMLLSESAIAINRAAISEVRSDPSLSEILIEYGRSATLPILKQHLEQQQADGNFQIDNQSRAAEDFLGLLIGDLQIRRLLGSTDMPDDAEIARRAKDASTKFVRLYKA